MKDRSVFVFLIVFLLTATGLIIKSFLPSSRVVTNDEGKIVLRLSGYGGYLEEEYVKEIKEKFEQMNPHIQVYLEISPISIEDMQFKSGFIPGYEQRVLSDYAAKAAPDVFYVPPGRLGPYLKAGALVNIKPFLGDVLRNNNSDEVFILNRGSVNLGMSSQTKYPKEASLLMNFIYEDYQERLETIRVNAIKKASDFLLPDSGLENNEAFQEAWNAFATAMHRSDLVLWTAPDREPLYWGFRAQDDPDDYIFVQLGYQNDKTKILSSAVSLRAIYADNQKMVDAFKTCLELFIRTIDPSLTSHDVEKVFIDLGFDVDNFDLLPFHMIGAVYHNGYEYYTEAIGIDIDLTRTKEFYKIHPGAVYRLKAKKQDMLRTPFRRYPN